MNIFTGAAAAATAAMVLLTACGGSPPHARARHTKASPAAAKTPAAPQGCGQAMLAIGAVRADGATEQSFRLLRSLGKSLPDGTLSLGVDHAALDLALFREHYLGGSPRSAASDAENLQADLDAITAYCRG